MKSTDLADVRRPPCGAAEEVRANSKLTPTQFGPYALGSIFLAYAEA